MRNKQFLKELPVLLSCLAASAIAAEEQKKKDDRGKRNLEQQVSHPYAGPPSYRLERRISLGHHPLYPPPQFFPGPPRPHSPYRKGRPHSYPVPPYAVQMEPLVHYSQRDPLYDNNIFSLNTDPHNDLAGDDLLTENNHIREHVHGGHHSYGPHKPHIIERPVYIKEPEPIIEIIIKESNVSLPTPPPPPPPKKKKEQVQVFYVKYKKNPHGIGKDSVIYDKPIPAISPQLPEEEEQEEEEAPYSYQHETATALPRPTTTLRTIIKPDSEIYHSPSGVKVTFGKEGFDYSKRSSKAQDYNPSEPAPQFPQGRQLSSFSNTYFKRPYTNQNAQAPPPPGFRAPQPYRPFVFPPQSPPNYKPGGRQSPPQFPPQQKFPFAPPPFTKPISQQYSSAPTRHSAPPSPQFSHTISHPAPPSFQNPRPPLPQQRQPVPYKPFDYIRPQQTFTQPSPQPNLPPSQPPSHINPNSQQPQIQFRPETHFPIHQQLPLPEQSHIFNPRFSQQEQLPPSRLQHQQVQLPQQPPQPQHQQVQLPQQPLQTQHQQSQLSQQPLQTQSLEQTHYQHQINHNQYNNDKQQNNQQNAIPQNEHLNNLQTAQNILPPGGQLIQSVPKYEQHTSEVQPINRQENLRGLSPQDFQQKILQQFNFNNGAADSKQQNSQEEAFQQQQKLQEQFEQQKKQQEQLRTAQQYYHNEQLTQQRNLQKQTTPRTIHEQTRRAQLYVSSTPKITYQTTTTKPSTTTQEPEKPSTTTKDPKILEAQLPDEVPDDLREQLLSSGILNNADISVLDYDKIGDIPLSALPPDQLANFYGAGGAAQLTAGSAPVPTVLKTDGSEVEDRFADTGIEEDRDAEASEVSEVRAVYQPEVEMKVVKYDPETDKGQKVQEAYIDKDAEQVDPVILNDHSYNRYLPLKVNGTQFPIPDVPELKGKKISSVVVLAPVSYDFSSKREAREASPKSDDLDLIQGEELKTLLADPNAENYKKFLESENKTATDKQAVILLVTDPQETANKEKEIYMYDVATQTVSKLSGELSSAFVEAAEANSEGSPEEPTAAESNVVETRVPFEGNIERADVAPPGSDLDESASDVKESKIPIIDPSQEEDLETEASEQLGSFVDTSGIPVKTEEDLIASGSELYLNSVDNNVLISSGYSRSDHS
ncbi:bromodomain-containing protein 4-like [Anoplophora glabripennis]|uniref:bromodomain-containing protein 4-like n=1 Tax=Anoplophora glabripennis TaxID=217634 RepID=UPI000C768D6C|nr:bromodomain-containing protein 4-like [Anoplophora glabripennis]